MRNSKYSVRAACRRGLSILEVMFAIGVAIVGLLGIAAMLPLAGRNASDSVRVAEAQALTHAWYDDLIVQGMHQPSRWAFFQDFGNSNSLVWNSFSSLPTQRNSLNNSLRVTSKQAVCIDPYFLTSRDIRPSLVSKKFVAGSASNRYYRPTVFPYYFDTYNPIIDPVHVVGSTQTSTFEFTTDQPRMVRVAIGSAAAQLSFRAIQQLFASGDDLSVDTELEDRSLLPTRSIEANLKMVADGNYSWLATVAPTDTLLHTDAVDRALLSVVVVHRRDLFFPDVSSLSRASGTDPDIENKPKGERLFHVVPQTDSAGNQVPFRGGHGGTVTLVGSDGVDSRIHVGDWLMLAKNRRIATTTPPTTIPIFRWYRVVAVEGEPTPSTVFTSSKNTAPDECWERQVVLDGPDWVFDAEPTSATYIPGAVAVYERMIERGL